MTIEIINEGTVTTPAGFVAGATICGLKQSGNPDLAVLFSRRACAAGAVFTRSNVVAAPVLLDRQTLSANNSSIHGVVANAGIANACTGGPGVAAAQAMQRLTAEQLGCRADQIFVLSTGVIGVQLPMEKVVPGIHTVSDYLTTDGGMEFAQAIMTTDKHAKHLAVKVTLPTGEVTIGGVAKGSGMIHPNMATMLAVVTTDAAIPGGTIQSILSKAVNHSFNRISVDGDTSTNDTVLFLANGASDRTIGFTTPFAQTISAVEEVTLFSKGLDLLCTELAKMIVRDGEGVTKFVEILVTGASGDMQAHAVAETIATSPLVKTALAGSDPNWGRILAAAGRAGVPFDQMNTALWIANEKGLEMQLVSGGTPTAFREEEAAAIFAEPEIHIHLDLGQGTGEAMMWTGDLTHEYITINADYRT